jgi:phospholipid transport system substrate-binding protein
MTRKKEIKMRLKLNNIIGSFFVVLFGWLAMANWAQSAAVQSDPVALLQYIANNMIRGLKSNEANLKNKPQIVYSLAYKYVVPYSNLAEMSKRVLAPSVWNGATPAQRAQFEKEFTKTLIRTYASSLSAYKDQAVTFYPVRGGYQGKRSVEVESEINSSENQPIRVSYRLVQSGGVWRLFDLSVEGVDMLESFRSQYADILSQGSMDQLLQRMSSHNNRS